MGYKTSPVSRAGETGRHLRGIIGIQRGRLGPRTTKVVRATGSCLQPCRGDGDGCDIPRFFLRPIGPSAPIPIELAGVPGIVSLRQLCGATDARGEGGRPRKVSEEHPVTVVKG